MSKWFTRVTKVRSYSSAGMYLYYWTEKLFYGSVTRAFDPGQVQVHWLAVAPIVCCVLRATSSTPDRPGKTIFVWDNSWHEFKCYYNMYFNAGACRDKCAHCNSPVAEYERILMFDQSPCQEVDVIKFDN